MKKSRKKISSNKLGKVSGGMDNMRRKPQVPIEKPGDQNRPAPGSIDLIRNN